MACVVAGCGNSYCSRPEDVSFYKYHSDHSSPNMSVRYDWYQTDSQVVISFLLKSAVERNYNVTIESEKVTLKADNCNVEISLFRPVNVEKSKHKATSCKVEVSLFKLNGERWLSLEKAKEVAPPSLPAFGAQNWDKLANEITKTEEEDVKGEEALQQLFQKIYSQSSEEVRRAMNKSFSESGGTVLSTNWQEVGKGKVEVKPPDGAEFKEWKQ